MYRRRFRTRKTERKRAPRKKRIRRVRSGARMRGGSEGEVGFGAGALVPGVEVVARGMDSVEVGRIILAGEEGVG